MDLLYSVMFTYTGLLLGAANVRAAALPPITDEAATPAIDTVKTPFTEGIIPAAATGYA